MTVIYGQKFIQGIVLVADSRASKNNQPWADNTQKIFPLSDHLFISFCGDIEFAGSIIEFLLKRISKSKELGNPHIFYQKGPKLIKYAYDVCCELYGRNPNMGFIIAGTNYSRQQKIMHNGKVTGSFKNLFENKLFKISSPNFYAVEADLLQNSVLALGSGDHLIATLESFFKKELFNFNGIGPLDVHGLIISDSIRKEAEKLNEQSVGGLFQIFVIDANGSRHVSYKTRSSSNWKPDLLDLEMTRKNGRWIQRNLTTGKEIVLLYPPEVKKINDDSAELFALLNSTLLPNR